MKVLGVFLMIFVFVGCEPQSNQPASPREVEVYQILQEAAVKKQKDFEYFTTVVLKGVHPDSLLAKNRDIIKTGGNQVAIEIDKLEKELISKAGGGLHQPTKLPKKPNERTITAQLLKDKVTGLDQSLSNYVKSLKKIGDGVPLPDLKTWEGKLYNRYFEGATLMKCLIMLQQIKNDVWYNANLVIQRTSY